MGEEERATLKEGKDINYLILVLFNPFIPHETKSFNELSSLHANLGSMVCFSPRHVYLLKAPVLLLLCQVTQVFFCQVMSMSNQLLGSGLCPCLTHVQLLSQCNVLGNALTTGCCCTVVGWIFCWPKKEKKNDEEKNIFDSDQKMV